MPLERVDMQELGNLITEHATFGRSPVVLTKLLLALTKSIELLDKRSAHCPMCALTQGTDDDNHTNG